MPHTVSFTATMIYPEALSDRAIRGMIWAALWNRTQAMIKDWKKIVETWQGQPDFKGKVRYAGGHLIAEVWSDAEIIHWLDKGTSTRWAVMTKDFVPKTKVRWIGSQQGGGGVAVKGRRFMQRHKIAAQPGIEGRFWSTEITLKHTAILMPEIINIMNNIFVQKSRNIP